MAVGPGPQLGHSMHLFFLRRKQPESAKLMSSNSANDLMVW